MNAETEKSLPSLLHPAIQNATRALSLCAIVVIGGWAFWSGSPAKRRLQHETSGTGQAFQIDLNRASLHELMLLPGVGPRTARRILDDREMNGPYLSLHDLQRVPGIGPKTIQEISPHCRPVTCRVVNEPKRTENTWDRLPESRRWDDSLEAYPTPKIRHLLSVRS